MSCRLWNKALHGDFIMSFVSSVDFKTKYTFVISENRMECIIFGMVYSLEYCPFCGKEVDENGCTGRI